MKVNIQQGDARGTLEVLHWISSIHCHGMPRRTIEPPWISQSIPQVFLLVIALQNAWQVPREPDCACLRRWLAKTFEGLDAAESWDEYIPLAVWGDGVPYSKKESLLQVMGRDGL